MSKHWQQSIKSLTMNVASQLLKPLYISCTVVLPFPHPLVFSLTLGLSGPGELLHQGKPGKKPYTLLDKICEKSGAT